MNNHINQPNYEVKDPFKGSLLLFETDKRWNLIRAAVGAGKLASTIENPELRVNPTNTAIPQEIAQTMVQLVTAQPAPQEAPRVAHDSEAFLSDARLQVKNATPPADPTQEYQAHYTQDHPRQAVASAVYPAAVSPLFTNQAVLTENLPYNNDLSDEIDADPLAGDFDDLGYEDLRNVAA